MTTSAQPAPDLMFLLSWTSHALATEHAAGLAELGISSRAYCVLYKAIEGEQSGSELTQKQLADQCGIDKTTMVVTVDELEKAGLAERQLSSTDRRARIISVTAAGRKVAEKAGEIVSRIQDDVLGTLPATQRRALVDGLERLVNGRLATPVDCERPVRRRRESHA